MINGPSLYSNSLIASINYSHNIDKIMNREISHYAWSQTKKGICQRQQHVKTLSTLNRVYSYVM
jgi:predicted SprT family Zn-dependent metalloprotease